MMTGQAERLQNSVILDKLVYSGSLKHPHHDSIDPLSPGDRMVQVTAAIIIENCKVFIAKRKPAGRLPDVWEFPGGKLEPGETPEQCLKREIYEEFEIHVTVGEYLGTSVYAYDFGIIELLAYRTRMIGGNIRLNDHAEIGWATVDEITRFEFAPADLPFVEKLKEGQIAL
jgi:8-oxo-dGTP diphosphatase